MRGLCKEEDYEFLGMSEKATKDVTKGADVLEDDWRDKKERVRNEKPGFKYKEVTTKPTFKNKRKRKQIMHISVFMCVN